MYVCMYVCLCVNENDGRDDSESDNDGYVSNPSSQTPLHPFKVNKMAAVEQRE